VAGGHTLNIKQGSGPRNPRHPLRIRPGQRFFPLSGSQRQRITVKRLDGEWVRVEREDGAERRVSLDRLLASDGEGNGVNFRFHGWKSLPRGYRTGFTVLGIFEEEGRCVIELPEWDPGIGLDVSLTTLPELMQTVGAGGSCRADLSSSSEAGLGLHGFSATMPRELSRPAVGPHPEVLAEGQEYRRRADGKRFRMLEVEPGASTVPAWAGGRVVRLDPARVLATRSDGEGLHYVYLRGGLTATRRRRGSRRPRG
jgi:hypothetical protein